MKFINDLQKKLFSKRVKKKILEFLIINKQKDLFGLTICKIDDLGLKKNQRIPMKFRKQRKPKEKESGARDD